MKAHLFAFGSIEIDGRRHEHDVVIDRGDVRKRIKKPSKPYRARYGHTPLSADEDIPWSGSQLIIGTGAYGSLPITPGLRQEADRRGVKLVATSTADAWADSSGRRNTLIERWRDGVFATAEGCSGLSGTDPLTGTTDGGVA
jgi:hypothetical protein